MKAIIMGASSGIGLGIAEAMARGGIKVGLAARHTKTLKELKDKYPDRVEYLDIDVTHHDAEARMEELADKIGGMDLYLHVAGIGVENLNLDPETEVEMVRTNVEGFARCLSSAYRYMRSHGIKGRIAAVTSVAGTNGLARLSAYSASKAFDQTYMRALEQLSHDEKSGISFTDIRPGWVRTPLLNPDVKYPMEMSVEHVVKGILRALVQKKRVAVIDWRWNIAVGLWRCIPNALWVRLDPRLSVPDLTFPQR